MSYRLSIVSTVEVLREELAPLRADNKTIAFVPTMGALHEGHLSLIDLAREKSDVSVCSIFVNPKQFGEGEDLDSYPRPIIEDIRALEDKLTDYVFTPTASEMYPTGFSTSVSVSGISDGLCGAERPGHFDGVALVVSKLLMMVQPNIAIFGEKDFQQLLVIRRVVQDLNIPVEIVGAPIVRADDGLALSSRNQYLSSEERQTAPLIFKTLSDVSEALRNGTPINQELLRASNSLEAAGFKVDYIEARSCEDLSPVSGTYIPIADGGADVRLFVAARLGKTRLIDNMAVEAD